VGEFKDNDALGLGPALDEFGCARPRKKAAAILRDRGPDRRPVGLHRFRIGDLEFDDEIGGHGGLPWRSVWGLAAYGPRAPEPRDRVISLYASYFPVERNPNCRARAAEGSFAASQHASIPCSRQYSISAAATARA